MLIPTEIEYSAEKKQRMQSFKLLKLHALMVIKCFNSEHFSILPTKTKTKRFSGQSFWMLANNPNNFNSSD